ncbi:response regulator transcription factor [Gelria sp. Kuro-4]|uniref:response regulator transcription factor n=1 Tax=Gelria sp. Kuro-4 TaxID=2796927 RepID=UPI001BF0F77A|nr:response regulator transcription factor [Gelria sp. Kuro-4]BCV23854.1 DNA-binding response regulator [Gelria sp. Kuro-4]
MARILVVDDEPHVVELVRFNLEKEGFRVLAADDGPAALEVARREVPDLIVLDLMLPGLSGLEVFRLLKEEKKTRAIPVIMLTARASEADRVLGLELGADDYIVKPFSPRELIARIRARLRRLPAKNEAPVLRSGYLELYPDRYEVFLAGKRKALTPKEFSLLETFLRNPGKVLRREFLLENVWGYEYAADTRTVDVHVRYLRQKIEADPAHPVLIETVRRVGYRFRPPLTEHRSLS